MDIKSLETRMQIIEDIEAIKQLQAYYVNCIITTDWDELVNCFAENGTFDAHAGTATGKQAIKDLFLNKISNNHIGKEGLYAVHPIIKVNGDKATGSWLLYIQFAQPRTLKDRINNMTTNDAPDWLHGFYENEYVRENGEWKIFYLKFRNRLSSLVTKTASG